MSTLQFYLVWSFGYVFFLCSGLHFLLDKLKWLYPKRTDSQVAFLNVSEVCAMFTVFMPWACSAAVPGFFSSNMFKACSVIVAAGLTALPCGYLSDEWLTEGVELDIMRPGQPHVCKVTSQADL